ncbi:hypothetical protein MTYM_01510 [Methylococcales bacterium]|nr:hypothetical protein MTYM_01510 [Methylococcales bacterium]
MVIDIITIALVIAFFIRGYMQGVIVALFSVIAFILGIIAALKLSELLASYLFEKGIVTSGWAQLLSYIILFVGVVILVRLLAKAVETALEAVWMGWMNKLLGGIFYAFVNLVIISTFLWLGNVSRLIPAEQVAASVTYPYTVALAPWVAQQVGLLWPMSKEVFADLEMFFNNINAYIQHVDTPR